MYVYFFSNLILARFSEMEMKSVCVWVCGACVVCVGACEMYVCGVCMWRGVWGRLRCDGVCEGAYGCWGVSGVCGPWGRESIAPRFNIRIPWYSL